MKYLVMVQGSQADYNTMSGKEPGQGPAWSEKDLHAMFEHMGPSTTTSPSRASWSTRKGSSSPG